MRWGEVVVQAWLESVVPFIPFTVLVFLRIGIVLASLPAPLGSVAPGPTRVGLALLLTLAVCAPRFHEAPEIPLTAIAIGRAAIGEVLVGGVIGMTVRVSLAAAEVAGNLIGLGMGQGFASTIDPTFGESTMPVGKALGAFAVLIWFLCQGHHAMIEAIAWSVIHAPPPDALAAIDRAAAVELGSGLLAQGLRIASPVVGTMFIVQLGMGLVARAAPRVQVFSLSFAITSAVGGVVLLVSMPSVASALVAHLRTLPVLLRAALGG